MPPPLYEIANRLGYASAQVFRNKFPQLCEAIIERRSKPSVDRALREALREEFPPSLNHIAKRFGYVGTACFREKFSDLCDGIIKRRKEYRAKQMKSLKIKLEELLVENPPPTLLAVSKRLGHKSTSILSLRYPDLSQALAKRHATYRKARFESIGKKLKEFLQENPPPTLRMAAARYGYAPEYLGDKFPKVCQAISKLYAQHRKRLSSEKKTQSKVRIRLLASELHAKGEYSSGAQLMRIFNAHTGLTRDELYDLLREIRRELSLIKSA